MDWKTMADGKEKREAYYCSREWSVLKQQVKKRSGSVCERCRHNQSTAVHHLTYARLYRERLEDLQDICQACHEFTHGKTNIDPKMLAPVKLLGVTVKTVYLAGKRTNRWPSF